MKPAAAATTTILFRHEKTLAPAPSRLPSRSRGARRQGTTVAAPKRKCAIISYRGRPSTLAVVPLPPTGKQRPIRRDVTSRGARIRQPPNLCRWCRGPRRALSAAPGVVGGGGGGGPAAASGVQRQRR